MKWTTIQENGDIRTIDTNNASLLDYVIEIFSMWFEGKKKNGKKQVRKNNK